MNSLWRLRALAQKLSSTVQTANAKLPTAFRKLLHSIVSLIEAEMEGQVYKTVVLAAVKVQVPNVSIGLCGTAKVPLTIQAVL